MVGWWMSDRIYPLQTGEINVPSGKIFGSWMEGHYVYKYVFVFRGTYNYKYNYIPDSSLYH